MSKHTREPWIMEHGRECIYIGTPKVAAPESVYEIVATVEAGDEYRDDYNERARANARLIAAAPDLLEAARAALTEMLTPNADYLEAIAKVRAAIAKAEGE